MRLASSNIHGFGGLLDEADDVAHAKNPRRHAFGMKRLELVQLFTRAAELDGLAGHGLQTQRRAAARVAVELGQNGAGDLQRLVEMRGHVDGFLAGGGVEHEQDFLRLHEVAQPDEFLHQRLVNLQPAGGIENQNVAAVGLGKIEGFAGNFQNIRFAAFDEDGNLNLFAERFQLVHRRRAVNVRRHEQRLASLFLEQPRELAARSGFARAVQTDHQDAAGIAAEIQRGVGRAEQVHEFVVDDFDDLLAGLDALDDFRADGLGFDALDEIAGDLEIHVGFQQRHADLAQGIGDVGLGNFPEPAQSCGRRSGVCRLTNRTSG